MPRAPASDPRTVARDIPGLLDAVLPQLTPGVVAHYNRLAVKSNLRPVRHALVNASSLSGAMLFELAVAVGEAFLTGRMLDWEECLRIAAARQRHHFDARLPAAITRIDKLVATHVGRNLAIMLEHESNQRGGQVQIAPTVCGFQWIANGAGDFAVGDTLIEVKCAARHFRAADYRQMTIYWLLSYAASLESNSREWAHGVLLNPRSALSVSFSFDQFLEIVSAGRSKIEILQTFASMVGSRHEKV